MNSSFHGHALRSESLNTLRGLGIACTFVVTGSLGYMSTVTIPSILHAADYDGVTAQSLARQFQFCIRNSKPVLVTLELCSIASFGILALTSYMYRTAPGHRSMKGAEYALSALAILSVIPWNLLVMDSDTRKIISLAQPGSTHANDKTARLDHGRLNAPASADLASITPVEEFEPYEDAPFSGAEYELLKVKELLKSWKMLNQYRVFSVAAAGVWAVYVATSDPVLNFVSTYHTTLSAH